MINHHITLAQFIIKNSLLFGKIWNKETSGLIYYREWKFWLLHFGIVENRPMCNWLRNGYLRVQFYNHFFSNCVPNWPTLTDFRFGDEVEISESRISHSARNCIDEVSWSDSDMSTRPFRIPKFFGSKTIFIVETWPASIERVTTSLRFIFYKLM